MCSPSQVKDGYLMHCTHSYYVIKTDRQMGLKGHFGRVYRPDAMHLRSVHFALKFTLDPDLQ